MSKTKKEKNLRIGYILDFHCRDCYKDCTICPYRMEMNKLADIKPHPMDYRKKKEPVYAKPWINFRVFKEQLDELILQGYNRSEIAKAMNISIPTLTKQVRHLAQMKYSTYKEKFLKGEI